MERSPAVAEMEYNQRRCRLQDGLIQDGRHTKTGLSSRLAEKHQILVAASRGGLMASGPSAGRRSVESGSGGQDGQSRACAPLRSVRPERASGPGSDQTKPHNDHH